MIKLFQTIVIDRDLLDKLARLQNFRENIDEQAQCANVDDRGDGDAE